MSEGFEEHREHKSHGHHNRWSYFSHFFHKKALSWLFCLFCLLLIAFIIVIFVLAIVDFTRENTLETMVTDRFKPNSLFNDLKKGLGKFLLQQSIFTQTFCYSKIYRFNKNNKTQDSLSLVDNFKLKLTESRDPADYLFDSENKYYINKGKYQIKKYQTDDNKDYTKVLISFSITSNLPMFSSIQIAECGLDIKKSNFMLKTAYILCSNDKTSERKCDKYSGFYNDYYGSFESNFKLITESQNSNNKQIYKNKQKYLEDLLKGHFYKKSNKEQDTDIENEIISLDKIEQSTFYILIFFINGDGSNYFDNNSVIKDKEENIAFILEPKKC